jgi:transketolase
VEVAEMQKDQKKVNKTSIREVYAITLAKLGEENKNLVVMAADALKSTGGHLFGEKFPDRVFNFGIAEANMVTAAAGMALLGKIPVVSAYGFLLSLRACEQVRTDICYSNVNVKLVAAATGLAMGPAGPTHQCNEDIAIMRSFPNMTIVAPGSTIETVKAMKAAFLDYQGPVYFRFERNPFYDCVEEIYENKEIPFEIGKAVTLKNGQDLTIIGTSRMVGLALETANVLESKGLSVRVINMHTIKPLDIEIIKKASRETKGIVTVEEHNIFGGLGEAVSSAVCEYDVPTKVRKIGIKDEFCMADDTDELWVKHGLTRENIIIAAESLLK